MKIYKFLQITSLKSEHKFDLNTMVNTLKKTGYLFVKDIIAFCEILLVINKHIQSST